MVTSSAVVGSSAMSSLGSQASAIGDHDALAHAAGELVRILPQPARRVGDADQLQQLHGAAFRRGMGHAAMLLQPLGELPPDGQHRVQRGHRLLEHHADVAAAHLAHLGFAQAHQVAPGEPDLALRDAAGRVRDQAQNRHGAHGLAGAALADDRNGFARIDRIRNAVDRAHDSSTGTELGVQTANL